jgi:RHS repeat-associated protein
VFAVTAGTHTIKFLGLDSAGGDNTALIDAVNVVVSAQPIQTLQPNDPGFETPNVSSTVVADPAGSGWTFSGTAGIAGNGSSFNPSAPQGSQVAYVEKSTGSFSQTITLVPGYFQISFQAAQRSGNSQFFAVVLDSTTIGIYTPAGTSYQQFTSTFISYWSGAHTLQFIGENTSGDNVAFIDAISITPVTAPQLQNESFEAPWVAPGTSTPTPGGAAWAFTAPSGIAAINSSYTSGANPPDGGQVAYLEQTGSFSQSMALPAGSYQIGFQSAQRSTVNTHPQIFNVLVDGNVVGSFTPTGTTYQGYYTGVFTVAAGSHTITFQGVNSAGGDNTALIDSVFIAQPPPTSAEDNVTNRPITYTTYDNLDEVTSVAQYDGDGVPISATDAPGANLLRAEVVTSYDDQGRVYKTQQYDVNQSNGSLSATALTDNLYYDGRGDQIADYSPGGLVTKDQYDGAGRLIVESQTDGSGGTTYTAASGLTGDNVLEQTLTTYDNNDNPILVVTKERFHNDNNTGALGGLGGNTPNARTYYVANYYDAVDRLTANVNVGTNAGAAYTRPAMAPGSSDTTLVTTYAYTYNISINGTNIPGLTEDVTDPRGILTRTFHDVLDRPTQTVVDYTGYPAAPTTSTNQTTNTTYDGMDNVLSVTAVMPSGTPSQITGYVYGVSPAAGNATFYSNDVLATLQYPDPTTGDPSTSLTNQENYQYNTQGDLSAFTDANGTTHVYGYDGLDRTTSDSVAALGMGVNGAVLQLANAYDTADRPYLYTSLSAPNVYATAGAGTAPTVVNQVLDTYNGLSQLTGEYQEHNGAVNTATSPEVQYAYTEMSGGQNNSRPTSMTYPNGRKIDYVYGTGVDSNISRLTSINDDSNGNPGQALETYSYLGLDTIVQQARPQANGELTYIQQTGESNLITDGGDQYTGLDRFGRVVDQNWAFISAPSTSAERFQYGYDRAGNALYQNNLLSPSQSELYRANSTTSGDSNTAYDPLGRMTAFARGTLSSSGHNATQLDTIATTTRTQTWSLDAFGNWSTVASSVNGGTQTNLTRNFNAQNQTTGTSYGYDHNGNSTLDNSTNFTYDAWNRLISASGSATASYAYDALGRRIVENYSGLSTTNHLYYSPNWQVIEERKNGTASSNVNFQYVWGAAYIDELVLRDTYSGGLLQTSSRLYAQQDANYDTTSLIDTTGTVKERYEYDPYGAVSYFDAGWNSRSSSSYGWQYLHQGGRLDVATGWYGFRNRDLIPSEGRWAERDPLGLAAGDSSLYRYENNTPIGQIDPSGLMNPGENHCYPLHLGGHPHGPTYFLDAAAHTRFHDVLTEAGVGPRSGIKGLERWAKMSKAAQRKLLMKAMRAAGYPEAVIRNQLGRAMRMAHPGINFSPFRRASAADLAKLARRLGITLAVLDIVLNDAAVAEAAEVKMDWRDPYWNKRYGDRPKKGEVAVFKKIVIEPTALNLFGSAESLPAQQVSGWEDLGPMSREEAALLEGVISRKVVYSDDGYTVYEYTYWRTRWGGVVWGLPDETDETAPRGRDR